ncbi:MAG: sulfotransferase [Robiginitomaculum sp.]|nr:sulfotransferase [Robiginitomaculum sp.]
MKFAFLMCTERSGSNFIVSLMNGHPEISGPPSSHLFRLFGLNAHNYFPIHRDKNWQAFLSDLVAGQENMLSEWETKIDAAELETACPNRTIREALDYTYNKECRGNEQLSFVKENYTHSVIAFLLATWPDAQFVFQVRDPRDVAASWIKTRETVGGIKEAVQTWVKDQTESLRYFNQMSISGRALQIRYEDLVADTSATAKKLCQHVGVKYDPVMLDYYKDKRTVKNAKRIQAWGNLAKPVMTSNFGKYKKSLSQHDIRYIELNCHKLMTKFGYALDTDVGALTQSQRTIEITELENKLSAGIAATEISKAELAIRTGRLALIERVKNRVPVS